MPTTKPRRAPRAEPEPTHLLNVDLDVAGRTAALEWLIEALGRRLFCLHASSRRGVTTASFELRGRTSTVDQTMRGLLTAVEGLPLAARRAWRAARVRDLNVGLQAGRLPHATEFAIAPATIARAAALGARVVVTVYAPFPRPRVSRARRGSGPRASPGRAPGRRAR